MAKIILLYDYLSEIGGVERVVATHAKWLKRAGHEVSLAFNYVDKEASNYGFFRGLDIKESCSLKFGSESFKMYSALFGFNKVREYRLDLAICYSFPSVFISKNMKCKKYFYYLPMEFIYFPLKKRWEWANDGKRKMAFFGSLFLAPILKIMDKKWIKNKLVIANSEFTRREIKERYNADSVISYPPLNSIFKPQADYGRTLEKYGIKGKFILTAGRIVPDKKTDWLIEVFSKLDREIDFVIAGEIGENYKKRLEELAKQGGVLERLKLIGIVNQEELVKLYSASEIFVFASPKEAFGLVPIEAMACGCPVVAWNDNAGPNEYVIPGLNGYLAKPYDLNDFKGKAEELIKSNFKKKNKRKIVNSVKKFREEKQYKLFVESIENGN